MKVIFHLDIDSYFVSASRIADPTLNNKPVVISDGGSRSIISAASYEAKNLGIWVPMSLQKAKNISKNLVVVKPNFALYTSLSSKIFDYIIDNYTPKIEISSIDECFIDVTDIWKKYGSPFKLAQDIQDSILKKLKLPISIGISSNKFVAKMATQINKPFGITIIKPGDFLKVCGDWEIRKYHGIGPSTANKLINININTIKDLAMADIEKIVFALPNRAEKLILQANGGGDDEIDSARNDLKSIGNSLTFNNGPENDLDEINKILEHLSKMVCIRAKARNALGKSLTVGIKFLNDTKSISKNKQATFSRPTNDFKDIFSMSKILLDELYANGKYVGFLSVTLNNLVYKFQDSLQTSIFDSSLEKNKIEKIIQETNNKLKNKMLISGYEFQENVTEKKQQTKYINNDLYLKHFDKN